MIYMPSPGKRVPYSKDSYSLVRVPTRLLSTIGRTFKIYYRMTLDETSARAYRESRGQYLRHKQWEDISVNVYVI